MTVENGQVPRIVEARERRSFAGKRGCWIALLVVFLIFAVPSCVALENWYTEEKPWNYHNSTWISEDPYLILTVDDRGQAICSAGSDEDDARFYVDYRGNNVFFFTYTEEGYGKQVAHCSGHYHSSKFVVYFSGKTLPGVSDKPLYRVVFVRQE